MLLGLLILCLLVGASAAGVTIRNVATWYQTLVHPPLTPPNWLFAPAWTLLYIMMAVAAWLVWRKPDATGHSITALTLWGAQLALNASWPPVFFGLHMLGAGLAIIVVLFAAAAFTAARFWRLSRPAGSLMLPYLAWLSFAGYLNAGFWWLNR